MLFIKHHTIKNTQIDINQVKYINRILCRVVINFFLLLKLFIYLHILIKTMKNLNNILTLSTRPFNNGNGYGVQPLNLSSDFDGL